MKDRFEGKIALITGANSGIGAVIAQKFAEYGANIIIADVRIDEENEVFTAIRGMGRKVWGYRMDVSDTQSCRELLADMVKNCGKIDILVNNAGIYPAASILEETEEHFDRVVGVNMRGLLFLTQAVLKETMLPNQYGRIVNIASIDGKNPPLGQITYAATKAAVMSFTKSFALELAGTNVNCNSVCPGWVESAGVLSNDRWKTYLPMIPARRLGHLSEIAEACCFLCDDKVSYINGEILDVNGGMLMD